GLMGSIHHSPWHKGISTTTTITSWDVSVIYPSKFIVIVVVVVGVQKGIDELHFQAIDCVLAENYEILRAFMWQSLYFYWYPTFPN
ncbi:hypothetical protein U1Q18_037456, partial [Sarracenia purpurea var. burkii]